MLATAAVSSNIISYAASGGSFAALRTQLQGYNARTTPSYSALKTAADNAVAPTSTLQALLANAPSSDINGTQVVRSSAAHVLSNKLGIVMRAAYAVAGLSCLSQDS